MNFFDWDFALSILPDLLKASLNTLLITFAGFAIAIVVGLLLAIARRSKHLWLSWPVAGLIEFIRSTPLLIQVYFLFYVFPNYGLNLTALQAGILASPCTTPATPPRFIAPASTRCRAASGRR